MKKEHKILVGAVLASIVFTVLVTSLFFVKNKKTNQLSVVPTTNAPPVRAQTNTPAPSQVDLLAAEVKALKAANEERGAKVQRLLALNEQVRRERAAATNIINAPVTVNVTNSPPSVVVNTPVMVNIPPVPQVPSMEPKKGGAVLMEKSRQSKTRTPMYTITNQTSSVTVSGTNLVSATTNTVVKNYLYPPKRSFFGAIFGGRVEPISTDVPAGSSIQQGYSQSAPVVVVEQPPVYYSGYSYGYSYPYAYVPAYGYYGGGGCRRLFGVRFHAR